MEPFPVYTVALEPEQEGPSLSGACCATLRLCGPHRAEHPRGPEGKERGVQRPGFGHGGGGWLSWGCSHVCGPETSWYRMNLGMEEKGPEGTF